MDKREETVQRVLHIEDFSGVTVLEGRPLVYKVLDKHYNTVFSGIYKEVNAFLEGYELSQKNNSKA
jgi:hypothetical protein